MPRDARGEWEIQHAVSLLAKKWERYERVLEAFLMVCKSYKSTDFPRILKTVNQRVDMLESRLGQPASSEEDWFKEHTNGDGSPKDEPPEE
jgi:hypothetical protein